MGCSSVELVPKTCSRSWPPCFQLGLNASMFLQAQTNRKLATLCPRDGRLDESVWWLYFVDWNLMDLKCKCHLSLRVCAKKAAHCGMQVSFTLTPACVTQRGSTIGCCPSATYFQKQEGMAKTSWRQSWQVTIWTSTFRFPHVHPHGDWRELTNPGRKKIAIVSIRRRTIWKFVTGNHCEQRHHCRKSSRIGGVTKEFKTNERRYQRIQDKWVTVSEWNPSSTGVWALVAHSRHSRLSRRNVIPASSLLEGERTQVGSIFLPTLCIQSSCFPITCTLPTADASCNECHNRSGAPHFPRSRGLQQRVKPVNQWRISPGSLFKAQAFAQLESNIALLSSGR